MLNALVPGYEITVATVRAPAHQLQCCSKRSDSGRRQGDEPGRRRCEMEMGGGIGEAMAGQKTHFYGNPVFLLRIPVEVGQ